MLKYNTAADIHEASICDDDYQCNVCYYGELGEHEGQNITKLISCDSLQYGDYDNSCAVERANVRYLEQEKLIAHKEMYAYGGVKAWVQDTEENRELLTSLLNYPCFDDELVSEIENEIEQEYIKDCASDLHKLLSDDIQEAMQELFIFDTIDQECYEQAKEASNTYFAVESGGNGYIDFKRIVNDYALAICDKHPAIKSLCAIYETVNNVPAFPVDFYENAEDMQSHRKATSEVYNQDESQAIMSYAVELESLINQLRRYTK